MKISNPRFLCTENPQPQIELLSLIVLEYICCKILAWFFSVSGLLHDSCNFTFAMRWVFWKVKRPQGWAFRFSNTYLAVPVIPTGYHGEKNKQHKVFMLGKALSSGFYQNQVFLSSNNFWPTQVSVSLAQQFVNNTGLYVSLELQFVTNRRLYDIQLISYYGILSRRSTGSMHIVCQSHHHCKLNTISFECLLLHLVIFCTWLILSLSLLIGVIAQCLMLPVREIIIDEFEVTNKIQDILLSFWSNYEFKP